MFTQSEIKEKLGTLAAREVTDGMVIGAGTGSTANEFIRALGLRVKDGLICKAVPTSLDTEALLIQYNIPLADFNDQSSLDLVVDGADEIDEQLQLIKGGGGALLQEKIVAYAAKRYIIIADESKLVQKLGAFPLPVEVIPFGYRQVKRTIENRYGEAVTLRLLDNAPYVTDHHNYILDLSFSSIQDLHSLAQFLESIPGLVGHGLFLDMAQLAIVGFSNGEIKMLRSSGT